MRVASGAFGCSESNRFDRQRCPGQVLCSLHGRWTRTKVQRGPPGIQRLLDVQQARCCRAHKARGFGDKHGSCTRIDVMGGGVRYARGGPKGMPLMNLIISYYETGTDSSVALSQMHLLSLQLSGKSLKEVGDFVKKTNYVLHGLKPEDRPAQSTLYAWLWHQVKRVLMLSRVTERIRNSKGTSKKRTFDWLWAQIAEELRERRHDSNFENVSKGLQSTAPAQAYMCAACCRALSLWREVQKSSFW